MFKAPPVFKGYGHVSLTKVQKAVGNVFKYGKMPISGAKKFQAGKQISADFMKVGDKVKRSDLDKSLRHLRQSKIFNKEQADCVSGYLINGSLPKVKTALKAQESAKTQKISKLKTTSQKAQGTNISPAVSNNKISNKAFKPEAQNKKEAEADRSLPPGKKVNAEEAAGFKPQLKSAGKERKEYISHKEVYVSSINVPKDSKTLRQSGESRQSGDNKLSLRLPGSAYYEEMQNNPDIDD